MMSDHTTVVVSVNNSRCLTDERLAATVLDMELKDRIRAAREHARLTQSQLASLVGLTQQMIAKMESGKAEATSALLDIWLVTQVSPYWLARDQGEMLASHPLKLEPTIVARTHAELDSYFARLEHKNYDIEADPDLFVHAYMFLSQESKLKAAGEKFDFGKWLSRLMAGMKDGKPSDDPGGNDRPKGKGGKSAKT